MEPFEEELEPVALPPTSNSYIDLFQQELAEIEQNREIFIPVELYKYSGTQIKYRMLENIKELDTIVRNAQRQTKNMAEASLYANMDTIIKLCDGIYVQPPTDDLPEPVMLDPDNQGFAVTFSDERLGHLLGLEGEGITARKVLRAFFGGHDMAINAHAERLINWLRSGRAESIQEMQMGEL